jgi:tubulin---tyrosine ligase
MATDPAVDAYVCFPDAKLTESLIKKALDDLYPFIKINFSPPPPESSTQGILQWSTYDLISHELTISSPKTVLSSSYIIRKCLIRKHFLHRAIQAYLAKNNDSALIDSIPKTWDIEITHADELEELWIDELYDLASILPDDSVDGDVQADEKWFILKPGMADRGMGIRLFRSKAGLQRVFESFEEDSEDGAGSVSDQEDDPTKVVTSHLRHFVIQVKRFMVIVSSLTWIIRNIF